MSAWKYLEKQFEFAETFVVDDSRRIKENGGNARGSDTRHSRGKCACACARTFVTMATSARYRYKKADAPARERFSLRWSTRPFVLSISSGPREIPASRLKASFKYTFECHPRPANGRTFRPFANSLAPLKIIHFRDTRLITGQTKLSLLVLATRKFTISLS